MVLEQRPQHAHLAQAQRASFHEQLQKFRSRIHSELQDRYQVDAESVLIARKDILDPNDKVKIFVTDRASNEVKEAAFMSFKANQGVLKADIYVAPEFRRLGIYNLALSRILQEHPETSSMPTRFPYPSERILKSVQDFYERDIANTTAPYEKDTADAIAQYYWNQLKSVGMHPFLSDNAKNIVDAMFEHYSDFLALGGTARLKGMSPTALRELREKIVRGFIGSPAAKIRIKAGFSKMTRFIVDPTRETVAMDVKLGESDPEQADVMLVTRDTDGVQKAFKISSEGQLTPVETSALLLPGYDEMMTSDLSQSWIPRD